MEPIDVKPPTPKRIRVRRPPNSALKRAAEDGGVANASESDDAAGEDVGPPPTALTIADLFSAEELEECDQKMVNCRSIDFDRALAFGAKHVLGMSATARFTAEGKVYKSISHYLCVGRANYAGDKELAKRMLKMDPFKASEAAREVPIDKRRWAPRERDLVLEATQALLRTNANWRLALLATGTQRLIYCSKFDGQFGVRADWDAPQEDILQANTGGTNVFGILLERLRNAYRLRVPTAV